LFEKSLIKLLVHRGGFMNFYEFIFAFRPDLPKEVVDELNNKIQSYITDNKGKIDAFDNWGLTKLAYPIENYFDANFYLCRFSLAPEFISELRDIVRLTEKVLRYNIMKIEKDFSLRKKKAKKVVEEQKIEEKPEEKIVE
jgi:small subunit ribosomal protein S6